MPRSGAWLTMASMRFDSASLTSETLLGRLRQSPNDPEAWDRFVACYGPRILGWCKQWRLQEADAEDVTQDVLLRLARKMGAFAYDSTRSFRGWLRTLTHHAYSDFLAERARPDLATGNQHAFEVLQSVEARADLMARLEEQFDQELMGEALARVRLRVEPQTWEAFQRTAVGGLSGEDAATQLNMRLTAVFKAKSRVLQLLREEVARLEQGGAALGDIGHGELPPA